MNKIVEEIVESGWLRKHCQSLSTDKDLMLDLEQEICLILLEYKKPNLIMSAYSKGEHLYFIKRIISNQYNSSTSPFWKKYRSEQTLELMEEIYNDEDYK